jgi:hypothetical protein
LTAVHDHRVAEDEGGCVRAQPDDDCGNLLGLPIRPIGSFASLGGTAAEALHHLVSMITGQIAFTRMFDAA